jgi:putative hydrolase of the HAD superfamily
VGLSAAIKSYELPRPLSDWSVVGLLRAVVFDLGDTLVHLSRPWEDVFRDNLEAAHSYLTKLGLKLDFQQFAETFMRQFNDASEKAGLYKVEIPMQEIIAKTLRKAKLEVLGVDLVQNAMMEFYQPEIEAWQLYPDTIKTLETLREQELRMGLISNAKSEWFVSAILEKFNLRQFFDVVITSAEIGLRKPRADIFMKALSSLNIKASEAVFVGDSLYADILGAKAVGIQSIHLVRKPLDDCHVPDRYVAVASLTEALDQIANCQNASLGNVRDLR